MVRLAWRNSGLRRSGAIGRTRPNEVRPAEVKGASAAWLGAFGKKARTEGSLIETVNKFTPSKFNESSDTFRKASIVTSANEARMTDLPGSPKSACRKPD